VDANSDGVTETGELKTLSDLGIASISTQADTNLSKDNGNLIGLTSSYQTTDGATHAAADVWFVADANQANAAPNTPVINTGVAIVPPAAGAVDTSLAAVAPADDLRSRVSSLAQALSAFGNADPLSGTASASSQLTPTGATAAGQSPVSLTVSSMVSVMQQFDANGNMVGAPTTGATPLASALSLTGGQAPAATSLVAPPTIKPLGT